MNGAAIAQGWGTGTVRLFEPAESVPEVALESVPCPNCDCRQFHSILDCADPLTGIGGTFCLVRCALCNLILTNPRPTTESLGLFYPEDYLSRRTEKSQSHRHHWRWLERLALRAHFEYPPQPTSVFARMLAQLAMWRYHSRFQRRQWIPFRAPGRLLDVGCGTGSFLERMQSFGWTVTGIEDSAQIAGDVERRTSIKIHGGTLPHPELNPESFDVVTMWHVMEHSQNPRQLVRDAASLLRPGGLLVTEVPNIESRTFAEFREHWFGLEMPRHLQHFSPKTLCATLPVDLLRVVDVQQIGLRSWIKRSAERAVAAGRLEYQSWLARGKAFWDEQALQSEIANQADGLRIIAERRS